VQVEALSSVTPFDISHLVRRFFGTLLATPLTPAEQRIVAVRLRPPERHLFWAQAPADQRHAFETMRRAAIHSDSWELLNAALLHDVGKAHSSLGAVGRSVATVLDAMGASLPAEMRAYRAHGELGAMVLEDAGASAIAMDFARRHPDPDPQSHDAAAWRILLDADDI
jgi:hypothetical protein